MQRLRGDAQIEAALLGAAGGGVGDVGGEMEVLEVVGGGAIVVRVGVLFFIFGEIDVGCEAAVGVQLASVDCAFFGW